MGFTTITDPDTAQELEVDFRRWLSITWANIVAHPNAEERRKHRAAGTGVDYAEGVGTEYAGKGPRPVVVPVQGWSEASSGGTARVWRSGS